MVALLDNGTIAAWGVNTAQLDNSGASVGPSPSPILVNGINNAIQVAVGGSEALILLDDGTVQAWGISLINSALPITINGLNNIIDIDITTSAALALDDQGNVWAWGDNIFGLLGNCTFQNQTTPTISIANSNIVDITMQNDVSIAILDDGSVQTWGNNWAGQLGIGTITSNPACDPQNALTTCNAISPSDFSISESMCCNNDTDFATIADLSGIQTETWDIGSHPFGTALGTTADPIYINGDINFVAGNNISMANLHFVFGPNGRIRIGPEATLTIAGCTLSGNSACETMWQGIQIFDNASGDPQNSLTTKENTIIKDAIVGIATVDLELFDFENTVSIVQAANINYDAIGITVMPFMLEQLWNDTNNTLAQTGGNRIDIQNTDFVNCYQGINPTHLRKSIVPYSDGYFSIVEDCNFRTEGTVFYPLIQLYPNDPKTEAGISSINSSVLDIKDCNFDNLQYGIRAAGSFDVLTQNLEFMNCDYPIAGRSLTRLTVLNSVFEYFEIGIQAKGMTGFLMINSCLFNTQNSDDSYGDDEEDTKTTAILLMANDFDVIGGYFTENANEIENVTSGVVLINNDDAPTLIKNNTITNTNLAVYALENNLGADIRCNTFTNYSGAAIKLGSNIGSGHLLADQGNCDNTLPVNEQRPAANIFNDSFNVTEDIFVETATSTSFEYFDLTPTITSINSNTTTLTSCLNVLTFDCNTTGRLMPLNEMLSAIQFADSEIQKNAQMRDILRHYAKDYQSLNRTEVETLAQLFDKVNTRATKRQVVMMYAQLGNWEKMEERLENLPLANLEDEHFYEVQKMWCALKKNGKNIGQINTEQEAQLLDIAQQKTKTAYVAQSLLFVAKGIEFPVIIPYEATKNENNAIRQLPNTTSDKIMLYPNPATDKLYLNLEEESNIWVTIYDISGQKRLEQSFENIKQCVLSTQNLQQGSYFLHLNDEKSSIVKPFVIMK
ncbi:MAG: T9SS type A sorting domain-containing protein [Chitinophagales bacterium]